MRVCCCIVIGMVVCATTTPTNASIILRLSHSETVRPAVSALATSQLDQYLNPATLQRFSTSNQTAAKALAVTSSNVVKRFGPTFDEMRVAQENRALHVSLQQHLGSSALVVMRLNRRQRTDVIREGTAITIAARTAISRGELAVRGMSSVARFLSATFVR